MKQRNAEKFKEYVSELADNLRLKINSFHILKKYPEVKTEDKTLFIKTY